ncbi:TPA: hypothetical protein KPE78_001146 [Clostridioides difficile]|nr:hypothetical protein [Clostridioides difficile]OFU08686.1 hypothetical protein HMPREF3083_03560 [Clostridium sp. HMSC19D07]MBG0082177.1 hypothetical protein [Clostridioides difficile]MBH7476188.1 hypothetical protein [Clostridioides difficile]MBY1699497.1 hypothetical protein [Clostridioides difficile]
MEWELKNHIEDTVLNTVLKNRGLDNQKINWILNADILNWEDNNNLKSKDLIMNILFSIKNNENGYSYIDIIDVESSVVNE